MRSHHVQEAARNLWDARERRRSLTAGGIVDAMYEAIAEDMSALGGACVTGGYDPEADVRVRWMRVVASSLRRGGRPMADADVESAVRFVLGVDVPFLEEAARRCGG